MEYNENTFYISPPDLIEFNYCKRFIYYMKCLLIPQFEKYRYKVKKGREIHEKKANENIQYLRKKINVVDKKMNIELYSNKYGIKGIVDEVLFLEDGTAAPLDYKYAKYNGIVYDTYKTQMIMYALLIEETFNVKVKQAFIVYCLSDNYLYPLSITNNSYKKVLNDIKTYKKIIKGYFPSKTKYKKRCVDCCYRKICIK